METVNFDETSLITATRQGDLEAFNQLVLQFQDLAYYRSYWILHDPYQAEEVTQDAFLQAYQRLDQFRGGSFRAWLVRIVTNASYDELRRRNRRQEQPLTFRNQLGEEVDAAEQIADPGGSLEELFEQKEIRRRLHSYLDELPREYRDAVVMVDLLEMDYAEAAAVLGAPLGTVKSRVARGRRALRDRLESSSQDQRTAPASAGHTRLSVI